jgi:tRNA uridine 5-carbamoylmethylation protein Kti12
LCNTPLEVCIERDSKRENPIGAKVITETYNRYKEYLESYGQTN